MIGAISQQDLVHLERHCGSYTKEENRKWTPHILRATHEPSGNVLVMCDNALCHSGLEDVFLEEEFGLVHGAGGSWQGRSFSYLLVLSRWRAVFCRLLPGGIPSVPDQLASPTRFLFELALTHRTILEFATI